MMKRFSVVLSLITAVLISVFEFPEYLYAQHKSEVNGSYTEAEKNLIQKREQVFSHGVDAFDRDAFIAWYEKNHNNTTPPKFIIRQAERAWNEDLAKEAAQLSFFLGMSLAIRGQYTLAIKALEEAKMFDPLKTDYNTAMSAIQNKMKPR